MGNRFMEILREARTGSFRNRAPPHVERTVWLSSTTQAVHERLTRGGVVEIRHAQSVARPASSEQRWIDSSHRLESSAGTRTSA